MHGTVENKQDFKSEDVGSNSMNHLRCVTLMSHLTSVSLSFFICKMEQIPPTSHDYRQEQVISVMIPYTGNVYFI